MSSLMWGLLVVLVLIVLYVMFSDPSTPPPSGCTDASTCSNGQGCVSGACTACAADADCANSGAGPTCDAASGLCVKSGAFGSRRR